jgi:glyoxylase-like metal-dependent hydrolase (beta-lactamase superfamily II)
MAKLTLKTFITGSIENNCYLVYDEASRKAFLIDAPEDNNGAVREFIKENRLSLDFLILTHAHFDHIDGLKDFKTRIYVHNKDERLLNDPTLNGSLMFGPQISITQGYDFIEDGRILDFCGQKIQIIHTPGHTPGSICVKLNNWLFSGDTLFFNSIGRTDVPLGSHSALIKSLKEKLMSLDDDLIVYPGHGPATTIKQERENNPFIAANGE